MSDHKKILINERVRLTNKLIRMGFQRENLEFNGKKHGRQSDTDARCVITYLVVRKSMQYGMGVAEAAESLRMTYANALACYAKGKEAVRGNNRPFMARLISELTK